VRFLFNGDYTYINMKTNNKTLSKRFGLFLIYISLPIFLIFTNPQNLPISLLIIPYGLLFVIIYVTSYLLLPKYFPKTFSETRTKKVIMSGVLSFIPVLVFLLTSIGQFNLWDIVLSLLILFLIAWYLLRVDFFK